MEKVMLSARNIHKRYGPVEVLKGVDIDINAGEIVSIVGPSGSGKSTLLHILGTLDAADHGIVDISGVRIESRPQVAVRPASWWKRLVHLVVDLALVSLFANLLFYFLLESFPALEDYSGIAWLALLTILIHFIYFTVTETWLGRSPAKFLTGCKVLMSRDFSRPSLINIVNRSLARLIPFEIFTFMAPDPVGWHDKLGNTIVSDTKIGYLEKKGLSPDQLAAFRNKRIGFVFQFHHLLPEFSALENVCIAGWIHSNKKEVRDKAIRLLTTLGLKDRLHNKPSQLSGGEQQRVAVARALINNPDIVFADEPTGNLDTANARELHQLFFDLRKEFNQTFLIVTHNEELAQLSDRMLTMKDGKMS
ncbi:MAG: ATP-binding cassette domain-containing protein [Flavisolibacter sp.]